MQHLSNAIKQVSDMSYVLTNVVKALTR
jgi:hypothetical protein